MSFGGLLPTHGDCNVKPMLGVLQSSSDILESLQCYSTVGFHVFETGCIPHRNLGRISYFGGEGNVCHIGLEEPSTIALLSYDL